MNREIINPESDLNIKQSIVVERLHPESFSQCHIFSSTKERKFYKPRKGIVYFVERIIVNFECMHKAEPETYGGSCWKGTEVCRQCLVVCAEPGCGRMVCKSKTCGCGSVKEDGKLYCSRHSGVGSLFSLLFGG